MRANGLRASGVRTLGWGREHKRGRSGSGPGGVRKAGGGGGKPLEALFPPAVKGRRQKLVILLPIITTGFQQFPSMLLDHTA